MMTTQSGERLMTALLEYIDSNGSALASGQLALKLHPRGLEYVAARLQLLDELDALKSTPVAYFRAAFQDLEDTARLKRLQQALRRVRRLRVESTVCNLRDPTRVNLACFSKLTVLELRGTDMSTSAWLGLAEVQPGLQCLTCCDSLEELQHLLAPYSRLVTYLGGDQSPVWPCLTSLTCTHNSFEAMDASLLLAPALRALDLSNNNVTSLQHLHAATMLTRLNASYNNIDALRPLQPLASCLRNLVLQGNAIQSLRGLEGLACLVELDLRCNLVASFLEVQRIQGLTALKELWLEGNPIAYAPFYRMDVLACFPGVQGLTFDGRRMSRAELGVRALRAAGSLSSPEQGALVPESWRFMGEYIGRGHTLWQQRPSDTLLLSPPGPSNPAARASPVSGSSPPTIRHSMRRPPSRRVVDFMRPLLSRQNSSDAQPSSPSPFAPASEFSDRPSHHSRAEAVAESSETVYRAITGKDALPAAASPPRYTETVLERLHEVTSPQYSTWEEQAAASERTSSWAPTSPTSSFERVSSLPDSPFSRGHSALQGASDSETGLADYHPSGRDLDACGSLPLVVPLSELRIEEPPNKPPDTG